MSPFRILHNCGSSSKLVLRKKFPTGVIKLLESFSKCVATAGVFICIVRNFGILKITLFLPTLSDQYIDGPLDVKRIIIAMIIIGIKNNSKTTNTNNRFTNRPIIII
jgi:hypothetical protein